jgi:hypothetical protein
MDQAEVEEEEETGTLTDFQKVVLCSVLCPNRLAASCDWLLQKMLGAATEESQMLRLFSTLAETPPHAPLLLHTWYGEEPALTLKQVRASFIHLRSQICTCAHIHTLTQERTHIHKHTR